MSSFLCVLASSLTTVLSQLALITNYLYCQTQPPLVLFKLSASVGVVGGWLVDFWDIPEPYTERSTQCLTPRFYPTSMLTCIFYLHRSTIIEPAIPEFLTSLSRSPGLETQWRLHSFPYPPLTFSVHLGVHLILPLHHWLSRNCPAFPAFPQGIQIAHKEVQLYIMLYLQLATSVTSAVMLVWVRILGCFTLKRMLFDINDCRGVSPIYYTCACVFSQSVVSDSLRPHGL